jgi:uncharacterized protein
MNKKITGIHVARALAVFGMIIVNFKVVIGMKGDLWLQSVAGFFDGKAAATFVVLAGVGLSLMTHSSIQNEDWQKWSLAYRRILKRALFLFVIGLSYIAIWPADILHFYGIYMIISIGMLKRTDIQLMTTVGLLIFGYPFLFLFFDYEAGWNFETLHYSGFWSLVGFTRNLLFNGFHPVIPWLSFMLFGIWLGRRDLQSDQVVRRLFLYGLGSFVLIQTGSFLMLNLASPTIIGDEFYQLMAGTSPMPPLPLYMLNGISIALSIITGCILLARKYESSRLIQALDQTGQLALTFYVAHVLIGMGMIEILGERAMGQYNLRFSFGYAIVFSSLCVIFALWWRKNHPSGPLEWLMRKITG